MARLHGFCIGIAVWYTAGCAEVSQANSGAGGSSPANTGGSTSTTARSVSVASLSEKVVPACAAGYEHPNVCCLGAPYKATVCSEDLAHPYGTCEKGQFAYPDPDSCCLLDANTPCRQPLGVDRDAGAGQQTGCHNPCLPGTYPPSDAASQGGEMLCLGGTGLVGQPREPFCSLCDGPVQWCSTPCPVGWSAPAGGQVDLCCQTDSSGKTSCFSQSEWIDGYGGGRGGASFSNSDGCISEQFTDDGNSYVMTCDFAGSNTCTCLLNGATTATLAGAPCDISLCGFPSS
jgi:hypothetical protein